MFNLSILYGKRLICDWELSLREQASTINKSIYRSLLSVHLTFFLFFYLLFEILHWCACCAVSFCVNREEKSLRHVAMVAKVLDDSKPKIHQKENLHRFKLHRSYLISFNLSKVGEIFLVESERTVSKFKKWKTKFFELVHRLLEAGASN